MRAYVKKTYPNKGGGLPEEVRLQALDLKTALDFWSQIPSLRTFGRLYELLGPETQLALDFLAKHPTERREKMPELYKGGYYRGRVQPHYRLSRVIDKIVSVVERMCGILEARLRAGTRLGIFVPTKEDMERLRLVRAYFRDSKTDPPRDPDDYQDFSGSFPKRSHR